VQGRALSLLLLCCRSVSIGSTIGMAVCRHGRTTD
jgi:hypothetical protein